MKTFYVTTPIYYANSLPHLGHLYTMIVADTTARSKRQQGIETFFLTGTDEHGINIERAAQRNNRTPQEQADYVVSYFKKMTDAFGLDTAHGGYDIFMRTTENVIAAMRRIQPKRVCHLLEIANDVIGLFLRSAIVPLRGALNIDAVFVRAGEKKRLDSLLAFRARSCIRHDHRIEMAEMGKAVGVVDGGCDVKSF